MTAPRAKGEFPAERPAGPLKREKSVRLFQAFLRLGLTAFGGPAMVSYIRDLAVKKNKWLTEESFKHGVAVCQSIPGATAMQVAAYVGLRAGGPLGAVATYVGFGLPAFFLMVVLAAFYGEAHDLAAIVSAFNGLQVIVVALVANAGLNFGRSSIKKWPDGLLALGAAAFLVTHGSPIIAIVASALLGLILYRDLKAGREKTIAADQAVRLKHLKAPLYLVLSLLTGLIALYFLDRKLFSLHPDAEGRSFRLRWRLCLGAPHAPRGSGGEALAGQ